jgi:hypothetical protein
MHCRDLLIGLFFFSFATLSQTLLAQHDSRAVCFAQYPTIKQCRKTPLTLQISEDKFFVWGGYEHTSMGGYQVEGINSGGIFTTDGDYITVVHPDGGPGKIFQGLMLRYNDEVIVYSAWVKSGSNPSRPDTYLDRGYALDLNTLKWRALAIENAPPSFAGVQNIDSIIPDPITLDGDLLHVCWHERNYAIPNRTRMFIYCQNLDLVQNIWLKRSEPTVIDW